MKKKYKKFLFSCYDTFISQGIGIIFFVSTILLMLIFWVFPTIGDIVFVVFLLCLALYYLNIKLKRK